MNNNLAVKQVENAKTTCFYGPIYFDNDIKWGGENLFQSTETIDCPYINLHKKQFKEEEREEYCSQYAKMYK